MDKYLNWVGYAVVAIAGLFLTVYAAYVAGVLWDWFLTPSGHALPSFRERVGVLGLISLSTTSLVAVLSPETEATPMARAIGAVAGTFVGLTCALVNGFILHWILPA